MAWLEAHVYCALLSYLAFLIGFASALMYLLQERQLKAKRMGWVFRSLPSLEQLDASNLIAITLGFALYSVALAFGAVMERRTLGHWASGDAKEVLSILTWLSYASLLYVRWLSFERGRKVAMASVVMFSWLVFGCFVARFVLPSWHTFLF